MKRATEDGTQHTEPAATPVFISYAREVSREHARALHEHLRGRDEQAFLDEADIEPGGHFPPVLVDALLASRVIVIFVSEAYFRRWYCQWELDAMLSLLLASGAGTEEQEKAALASILVVLPPLGEAVPELSSLPPLLRNSSWLRAGETEGLARLVRERLATETRTLAERLDAARQSSAQLRSRLLEEVAIPSPGSLAGMRCYPAEFPPSLGRSFVGRAVDLWRIHRALSHRPNQRGEGAALAAAVTGGGGFGKTRLVLEFLHRFGSSHYPGGLFWLNADVEEDRIQEQFHGILRTLKPDVPELVTFRKHNRNVTRELASALDEVAARQRVLYVVDNVPEVRPDEVPKPLSTWCPALGKVSLLVTSRTKVNVGTDGVQELSLATLMPDAAITLLTDGIDWKGLEVSAWRQIAEWVGFLPLALELLNRAIRAGVRPESLLARARDQGPVWGLEAQMNVLRSQVPAGALRGIVEALSISYERLSDAQRRAARLLAWLAPEPIPWKLLEAIGPEVSAEEVYTTLLSRHFVTPVGMNTVSMFGSMHRVLADYLRTQSSEPLVELRQVCQALSQVMNPSASRDPSAWPLLDACRAHAESVFERLTGNEATSEMDDAIALGIDLGLFLLEKGLTKQAQDLDERVVELALGHLGAEHPDTLTAISNLATALHAQGNFAGALVYQEALLEGLEQMMGEDHPETLAAMGNLAETLRAQGDLEGARGYQEQVLEGRRRVLGENHPDTLTAMHNLASTLYAQGDLEGARGYQEQVLEGFKRELGVEHPNTLKVMNNLAGTLYAQRDLEEARGYQEQVLQVRKRMLGKEHPATLRAIDNLAETLRDQGDLTGARGYQEQALEGFKRLLGVEHPDTLTTMGNLAKTLYAQGDLAGARRYQERVLEGSKRVLGDEHPATQAAMDNLAKTLREQGDLTGARGYQEQVLEVSRRVLGENHLNTLTAMNSLGKTLYEQGDLVGARRYVEQVVKGRRQALGEEHLHTLTAMNNLADTLYAQGDLAGARGYQERVLEVRRRVLGEEHPDTLKAMSNLAATLQEQGDLAGARGYQEQVLAVRRRVLGEEHPATLTVMNNLAATLYAQGDLAGARGYQERVLEVCERALGKEHPTTLAARSNLELLLNVQRQPGGVGRP